MAINSIVRTNTIWEGTNFLHFKVTKVVRKSKKTWIHYYQTNNPKQKFSCLEEAFIHCFHELKNLH